jgi:hypothetical protein
MKISVEKIIGFLYLACIFWIVGIFFTTSVALIYKIFYGNYIFGVNTVFSVLDQVIFVFLTIPLFFILKIIFWRKNKNYFNKISVNTTSKKLKKFSILIIAAFILTIFIYINFSNPSFSADYNFHIIDSFWMIMRNFMNLVVFPIILIFFSLNFIKDKDVNRRNQNLSDLILVMTFSLILINFTKLIAFIAYDCEIILYHFIKSLVN